MKIKNIILSSLLSILLLNSAFAIVNAATFDKINVADIYNSPKKAITTIDNSVIQNSTFSFNMPIGSWQKWVLVSITDSKNSKNSIRAILDVKNGRMLGNIYLPYGAGVYKVSMWTLYDKSKDINSGYEYIASFYITNTDKRNLKYILPEPEIQSDDPIIQKLAKSIIKGKNTDRDKTLAIHDWVAKNITYDVNNYFNNTLSLADCSSLGVLKNRKAICSGYANLVAALNRAVGIRTKIASGKVIWLSSGQTWAKNKGGDHAWNEVYINNKWMIEDVTWDSGYVNFSKNTFTFKLNHKYFDPKPSDFAKDHLKTNEN